MTICGHAGINFMRGPSFSNMVKSGRVKRGCFKLSDLSLQERGERYLLGAAVPSVRAINVASKPEDKIDCGGMSKPLSASVQALSRAIPERLSEVMRVPLQPLAPGALRAKLLALPVIKFDNEGARRDMHGERPRARLVLPKHPTEGWKEEDQGRWWAQDLSIPTRCDRLLRARGRTRA